jgi:hypothetical protein
MTKTTAVSPRRMRMAMASGTIAWLGASIYRRQPRRTTV